LPQRTGLGTARHDQDHSYQKILRLAACLGAPTSGVPSKGVLKDAMKFEFMVDDITRTAVVVGEDAGEGTHRRRGNPYKRIFVIAITSQAQPRS
jgi:hypothetical protein